MSENYTPRLKARYRAGLARGFRVPHPAARPAFACIPAGRLYKAASFRNLRNRRSLSWTGRGRQKARPMKCAL